MFCNWYLVTFFEKNISARDWVSHATVSRNHGNIFLSLSSVAPIIMHYYWNWKSPKWWTKPIWAFHIKRINSLSTQLIMILKMTKHCFFLLLLWKRNTFVLSNSKITIFVFSEAFHLCRLSLLGWWMNWWLACPQWALCSLFDAP